MNKLITKQEIEDLDPCHSLDRYNIPDSFSLLDILESDQVEDEDKLWLVSQFLTDKTNRLFAVWCARQVLTEKSDQRSIDAVNVAERYANGEATGEELESARGAVWSVVASITHSAARSAVAVVWSAAARSAAAAARSAQVKQLIKMLKG